MQKARVSIMVLLVLIGGLVMLLVYFIPHVKAEEYLAKTKSEVKQLKASFDTLSKTATGPLFEKPDRPPTENSQLIQATADTVNATRAQLEKFDATKSVLPAEDHIVLASKYRHAKIVSSEVDSMVAQTKEVLDDYEQLLIYLGVVNDARATLEKNTQQINAYTDLNALIGRQNIPASMEQDLRTSIRNLESAQTPPQCVDTQKAFIATISDTVKGFSTLSHGLAIANDATIYTGAAQIEKATAKYYASDMDTMYKTTLSLPILNDVTELTEKLAQFE